MYTPGEECSLLPTCGTEQIGEHLELGRSIVMPLPLPRVMLERFLDSKIALLI
jgi:hypothetical protein